MTGSVPPIYGDFRPKIKRLMVAGALVIIPGAVILEVLLDALGCTSCLISDAGLLEGILLQHASLNKIIENT